jgi:hypothetical protein
VLGVFTHSGRTVDDEFRILPANNQILDLRAYISGHETVARWVAVRVWS